MFSLNRISLIGYQTQSVDLKTLPSGTNVADLNIVVPHTFTTAAGEQEGRSFHTVTLWGGMAGVAGQFVRPGSHVFIAGRLQTDSWDDQQTGEKRTKTKVNAQEMILLDPKDGQLSQPQGAKQVLQSLNRGEVLGHVTRDPEMRTTPSGQHVLTLGVATNDRWKDKNTGEMRENTEFHNVVIWGDLAQETMQGIKKGNRVYAAGRVQTRSFETQAGAKRYVTEIIADQVSLLGVANPSVEGNMRVQEASASPVMQQHTSPQQREPASELVAAGNIPDINYESEIKAEDLPF
ncbi:hypothetical protein COU77_03825 [Candidatus Peregrinibacteria bacterium CG10_big_fil_rev_8_21_14_0_10_49_16]|nr:MAG: hypothetical protein COW95_00775 [Candidatus Peregrinibacteria bacterium CG22_combo_CG10-13_8_21_14_all_49_11]PIR51781.1 MAG: hypothetical protein COU77_03825 [Candidatus Peregrinibacteria bacterium CG10_big_fil_rev_8_21_14_0_10_49_16]